MSGVSSTPITLAVEGALDETVLGSVVRHAGGSVGLVHGKRGKSHVITSLRGYNSAARFSPWVVLVDLDHDRDCAPSLHRDLLPTPAPGMCFRIAVRAIEAWIIADRDRLARFLGVDASQVPVSPDELGDPKAVLVSIAERSSRRDIRADMVPRAGSGRTVGPAYTARMIEFVSSASRGWRPALAARASPSLRACIRCVDRLVSQHRGTAPRPD